MELCDLGRALRRWTTTIAARRCCGEDVRFVCYWIGGLVGFAGWLLTDEDWRFLYAGLAWLGLFTSCVVSYRNNKDF